MKLKINIDWPPSFPICCISYQPMTSW
jgi:hypothetical protein